MARPDLANPQGKSHGDPTTRTLGAYSERARFVDDHGAVRYAITSKAFRYGELNAPYVIAVNTLSTFIDHDDILASLFGQEVITVTEGVDEPAPSRAPIGAGIRHQPTNTRASAVLVGATLPSSTTHLLPAVYHNPWAQYSALAALPRLTCYVPREGHMIERAGSVTAADVFGLPTNWPGSEDE